MENKEILRKLRRLELCITAHPDCEKGSELEDRIIDLQEIQQALTIPIKQINKMSKRTKLQKEYYKEFGNYKGNGKYSDDYVRWLENKVLAINYK